jgi:hypothetical protein
MVSIVGKCLDQQTFGWIIPADQAERKIAEGWQEMREWNTNIHQFIEMYQYF